MRDLSAVNCRSQPLVSLSLSLTLFLFPFGLFSRLYVSRERSAPLSSCHYARLGGSLLRLDFFLLSLLFCFVNVTALETMIRQSGFRNAAINTRTVGKVSLQLTLDGNEE